MEYLALIHADQSVWETMTDVERDAASANSPYCSYAARGAGVLVGGEELASTASATTVRVRDEQRVVTDGPYTEVKEALGGFFILDCASFDDALDWAARIPAVHHGAVEVRPVHVDPEA